ncbi:MAG TPA: HAMP domain-containing sensor histidine kinase [Polyangiaceae bacterium]
MWFLPFEALAFWVIWSREDHALSLFVFVSTLALSGFAATGRFRGSALPFMAHVIHWVVGAALTGGVASPLLPMGLPVVASAALVLESRRDALLVTGAFVLATGALVFGWPHLSYPTLLVHHAPEMLAGSVAFTAVVMLRFGLDVTEAYTGLALELAARREELFTDAESNTRALEGVAARLAHEVKNPLAAIKGLSVHMARGAADAKTAERLGIVAQEADRLQSIVDGFLDFTRGLDDLRVARIVPYDVARELVVLLETRSEETGVAIEVVGDERAAVIADARKIRQALLNVVLNAMQASLPDSKVTIAVARASPDVLRVRVVDRGEGMKPAVLERIRKPHFTTRSGGSGLGLAITRAIVEQHGGTLVIESAEGKGTTVTIELLESGPPASAGAAKLPGI